MTRLRNLFAALAAAASLALPAPALAQSGCPTIVTGAVLTAAQWNACFQAKQDALGYTAVNRAGDTMTGRFITSASSATRAGFNLPAGTAPTSPVDGDVWTTTAGLFARINGATVGPFIGATGSPVLSVTNSDGTLTISPTTGAVIASINLSHANSWLATQTFSDAVSPTLTGGTGVGSSLTLKSTTGVGSTDAIVLQVGSNGATEAGRFVTGGQFVKGHTAALSFAGPGAAGGTFTPQIQNLAAADAETVVARWSSGTAGSALILAKSKGSTIGSNGVITVGTIIGTVDFQGNDGTIFRSAGAVRVEGDGTAGSADMPGRMIFSTTADGAATPTDRLTINALGVSTFAGNVSITGTETITSAASVAFTVGPNGATNPVLQIDASTSSAAVGLSVVGRAAAAGLDLSVISSGTNENARLNAKGSGTITFAGVSTGSVQFGANPVPTTTDTRDVGASTLRWNKLWLTGNNTGTGIDFGNGDVQIVNSTADVLDFAGAAAGYRFAGGNVRPLASEVISLGANVSGQGWTNLYMNSLATLNFGVGNYILTHSTGLLTANNPFTVTSYLRVIAVAVGSLASCVAGLEGARASVTDSNATSFTLGIGAVVAAGGSTKVPVYCDGTNWRIG